MSDLLFAYGTLLPGQERWEFLAPFVIGEGEAVEVQGSLYDTGQGYPAAVFSEPGIVRGRVFRLRPERAHESLPTLDHVEHSADEHYRRVRIDTGTESAWAYEYGGPRAMKKIDGGSWIDHVADRRAD